jgi:hypothetical protein
MRGIYLGVSLALFAIVVWSQDSDKVLPDGTGKTVTARVCGQCHSPEKFAEERRTKAQWDEIITKLVEEQGLEISEPDYNVVIAYLSKYLGKK